MQATATSGVYLDTVEAGWVVQENEFQSMELGVFMAGSAQPSKHRTKTSKNDGHR
jgi:hypothetical protein